MQLAAASKPAYAKHPLTAQDVINRARPNVILRCLTLILSVWTTATTGSGDGGSPARTVTSSGQMYCKKLNLPELQVTYTCLTENHRGATSLDRTHV